MNQPANLLFVSLVAFAFAANAQRIDIDDYDKRYSDNEMVELEKRRDFEIYLEANTVKVKEKELSRHLILSKYYHNYDKSSLYSNSIYRILKIEAKTLTPKSNSRYSTIKNENITISDDLRNSTFFDDQKKHVILFDGMARGAVKELYHEGEYTDARFFGKAYLADFYPIEKLEINLKVQKGIDLEIKRFNIDSLEIEKRSDKKFNYYTIRVNNAEAREYDEDAPEPSWYLPHVAFYVKNYQVDEKKVDYLNSPVDLWKWYSQLLTPLPGITNKQLVALADSINKLQVEEKLKAKAVFNWVQKNIKYIAFEDGMGGYIPRKPDLVFEKRYGDCKDMAFLIHSVLNHLKINSCLIWIGSNSIPYSFSQLPTPLTDNHMIACYLDKNKTPYFMDATDRYVPFGRPSAFIQNKQGLAATVSNYIDTLRAPVVNEKLNRRNDSDDVKIEGDELTGKGLIHLRGYNMVNFLHSLDGVNNSRKDDWMKEYLSKGNNKFKLLNYTINTLDTCINITYNYKIPSYVTRIKNDYYINMNIDKFQVFGKIDSARTAPYHLSYRSIIEQNTTLTAPQGFEVDYLPPAYSFKNDKLEITIKYTKTKNTVTYNYTLILKDIFYNKNDFAGLNKMGEILRAELNNSISLKKTNN